MEKNHVRTIQKEDDTSLWAGYKKRNPFAKHINPIVAGNFSKKRKELYAILARVSTDMQYKDGESFDTQIEKAKRLIEKKAVLFSKFIVKKEFLPTIISLMKDQ